MGILEWIIAISVLVVVAWVVTKEEDYVWARGALIIILISASMYVFALVDRHRGTPRPSDLPADVVVHGFKLNEDTMQAYVLLTETNSTGAPEYFVIDISEEKGLPQLPAALRKGRAVMKGKPFRMKSDGDGNGEEGGEGEGEGGQDKTGGQSNKSERNIIVGLPPNKMPEKRQ